jgi:hypothetical protein
MDWRGQSKTVRIIWLCYCGPRLIKFGKKVAKEFPKADILSGHRVTGAREKAGAEGIVRIPLKAFRDEIGDLEKYHQDLQDLLGNEVWRAVAKGIEALEPTETWTKNEQKILDEALPFIEKVLGKDVQVVPARAVAYQGRQVYGLHAKFGDDLPILVWTLSGGITIWQAIPFTLRREGCTI